jgi:hypothetical protein
MADELPHVLLATGDNFARQALQAHYLVLAISRQEIERGRVGDAVDRLLQITDEPGLARHAADRLVLWVSGYDDDPRPLGQIPQVRAFFQQVHAHWPYWLAYLAPETDQLPLLLSLLVEMRVMQVRADQVGMAPVVQAECDACVTGLARAYTMWAAQHGLPAAAVSARLAYLQTVVATPRPSA